MTRDELINAIEAAIGDLAAVYRGSADESDLYEAALLAIAVNAGRLAGGTELLTSDGTTPDATITFRRAPGNLWTQGITFAALSFPDGKRLEVHLGVMVAGKSTVAHECDVAIIDGEECDRSRLGNVHPRCRALVAAVEAKHYVASPGIGIGRGFLGLGTELGAAKCSLAFPASSSESLAALIARKQPQSFPEASPGTSASERLTRHIEQQVRNWLP